jgi:hypothetical protein
MDHFGVSALVLFALRVAILGIQEAATLFLNFFFYAIFAKLNNKNCTAAV